MKILKIFSVLLLVCYAAICTYLYSHQRQLIYFPQIENLEYSKQFEQSEIEFQHDGIKLHGWGNVQGVSPENPMIFYYGGNGDEASRNLSLLAGMGFQNFIAMNYRGYGRSGGEPDEKDLKKDALFVFDEIIKKYSVDAKSVILIGRSLGSGIATFVANEREVGKVVLITPYDSIVNVAQKRFPLFPVSLLLNQRFESNKLAPNIDEPVLCLLAENDNIVPNWHSHNLCDAWKGKVQKETLINTNHNNIKVHPGLASAISLFVR